MLVHGHDTERAQMRIFFSQETLSTCRHSDRRQSLNLIPLILLFHKINL